MANSGLNLQDALNTIKNVLPLLIPVVLIQWSLMVYALVKLFKAEAEPKYMPRWAWALIIIFVNLIGSIVYLVIGRREE